MIVSVLSVEKFDKIVAHCLYSHRLKNKGLTSENAPVPKLFT